MERDQDAIGDDARAAEDDDPAGLEAGELGRHPGRDRGARDEQDRPADVTRDGGPGEGIGEGRAGGDVGDRDTRGEGGLADRDRGAVAIRAREPGDGADLDDDVLVR